MQQQHRQLDVGVELNEYFRVRGGHGRAALAAAVRAPKAALRSLVLIGRLPSLDVEIGAGSEARLMRAGLLRTSRTARAIVRGTTAVLDLPSDPAEYLLGSSASKRSLRTKVHKADRLGFNLMRIDDLEDRRRTLRIAEAYERSHPDQRYRNEHPRLQPLLQMRHWFVTVDADGHPLLLAVPVLHGEWAVLHHFRTLETSENARLARFWTSVRLVAELRTLGVRYLADVLSPVGLEPGLREFQRQLGYRLVRVRIVRRARRRAQFDRVAG